MDALRTVDSYLAELRRLGRREHTVRGYRTDLASLIECASGGSGALDADAVAAYLARSSGAAAATQARRLSALRGLLRWCERLDLIDEALKDAPTVTPDIRSRSEGEHTPDRADVEKVLAEIPRHADRDQLLFGLVARLGLRPGEALALRIEDFDETAGCLNVPGWGGVRRRVLVDDRPVLLRLRNSIRARGSREGALFTATGRDTPLRYQSVQARWARYCAAAGVSVHLADLRRLHAQELLAGGVPETVVRQRLGQRTGPLVGGATPPSAEVVDEALRVWHARLAASGGPAEAEAAAGDVRESRAG
ncbi:tyrosine-type recombinase/integrase [Rathayibacter sp. CAU 1779]